MKLSFYHFFKWKRFCKLFEVAEVDGKICVSLRFAEVDGKICVSLRFEDKETI
jgi:hypothetical protein